MALDGAATHYRPQCSKMLSLEIHLALTTKDPGNFYFQSTNTPTAALSLCLLLCLMLCPRSSFSQHHPLPQIQAFLRDWVTGPGTQLTAHPSDYIWTLSGPCGPRPRPCLLPRHTGRRWAGPRSSGPSMAMCPPGCQARGRGGGARFLQRGPEPASAPHGTRDAASEKSTPPSSALKEKRPPLKGARHPRWPRPTSWDRVSPEGPQARPILHRGPRLGRFTTTSQPRVRKL